MWHNWSSHPPQLPNVPIFVRLGEFEWIDYIRSVQRIGVVDGMEWQETGIYREEFFSVTGRWE